MELENKLQRSLISWRTIEGAVTEHDPSENWRGAFGVVPVAPTTLRKKRLAMTTDGGPHDSAARVLREIDRIRDENGAPEGEPRHPELVFGKPWPIVADRLTHQSWRLQCGRRGNTGCGRAVRH